MHIYMYMWVCVCIYIYIYVYIYIYIYTVILIQIFLGWQKIVDMNSEILSSHWQMSKSRRQIYFLLLVHYQPTTLLRQAGNLLLENFGTLIFIMIT